MLTTTILQRTDTTFLFYNRNKSEKQHIFFIDHQGKKLPRTPYKIWFNTCLPLVKLCCYFSYIHQLIHACSYSKEKYLPPFTSPFVQIADIETDVIKVTTTESKIITEVSPVPAWPTTHDNLKNNITPQMFRRHRTCNRKKCRLKKMRMMTITKLLLSWMGYKFSGSTHIDIVKYHMWATISTFKASDHTELVKKLQIVSASWYL